MTAAAKDGKEPPSSSGEERRRCRRLPITFPIEISGVDSTGQPFCDRTVTTDVSAGGCRFDLLRRLDRGDEVIIRLVSRDSEKPSPACSLRFQIVWVETSDWGWSLGAEKLQPENIWHMAFPRQKLPEHSPR